MPDIFRRNLFLATMSIPLAVAVLAGAACRDSSATNATRAFADPDVARLATAVAAGDAAQISLSSGEEPP